jgi:transglutaminase superfamily protein
LGFLRRGLRWLWRPVHRLLIVHTSVSDPWEPASSFLIGPDRFGAGSRKPFSWYFEGKSSVDVTDVPSICDWLTGCQYMHDTDLFREPDFWQHPLTFEQLRKGDCEDHALWAWRKMVELGIPAQFYVGRWRPEGGSAGFHAWIVFETDGTTFVLEPVIKDAKRIVRPLSDVRADYLPLYSVDASFKMCARAGLLAYWREEELARRAGKRGQAA